MLEKTFNNACEAVGNSCKEGYRHCEARIHQSPVCAVLSAAVIGYIASLIPVCRIAGGVTRVALILVKPVFVVMGVLKALECLEKRCRKASLVERLEREREPLVDSPAGPSEG